MSSRSWTFCSGFFSARAPGSRLSCTRRTELFVRCMHVGFTRLLSGTRTRLYRLLEVLLQVPRHRAKCDIMVYPLISIHILFHCVVVNSCKHREHVRFFHVHVDLPQLVPLQFRSPMYSQWSEKLITQSWSSDATPIMDCCMKV